jgi:S-adenosylmethionine-diacylglycerol 3-amino-3-carboxypropyl transferase
MLKTQMSRAFFRLCHGHHLVYNACWEDPRLDRVAMKLKPGDHVLVITSAGCNALEYALDEPDRIDTVDVNPRQNALLELKLAAIRRLEYEQFFDLFGRGRLPEWPVLYKKLRGDLSPSALKYWDRKGKFFHGGGRSSFYFRGSAGTFAWGMNGYIDRVAKMRGDIEELLAADSLDEQREIYFAKVKPVFWGPLIRWTLRRDAAWSLLGVPRAQRSQLEKYYPGGIVQFVEDRLDEVFTRMPLNDNYFWRVYMTGRYTPECCPAYLQRHNFERLKSGLVDRIHVHTKSVLEFLNTNTKPLTHLVLLDHMDWLAERHHDILQEQWQAIVDRSVDGARILWRSAALQVEFVDPIEIQLGGRTHRLGDVLEYHTELAERLHVQDRVNTYGSFYIADIRKPDGAPDLDECQNERLGTTKDTVLPHALTDSR